MQNTPKNHSTFPARFFPNPAPRPRVLKRVLVSSAALVLGLSLSACGKTDSSRSAPEAKAREANVFQITVNGEQTDYTGMAMSNTFRGSELQLWNVQKAPVFDQEAVAADPEKAAGEMIGAVMDGNQLKISLTGVDLPNQQLPYRIAGTDEGMSAMSTPRATWQLTHDKKNYWGGAAMVSNVPSDWHLTIDRIDGEMLHGTFHATVVNMMDSEDQITLTDARFALRVKGIAGE